MTAEEFIDYVEERTSPFTFLENGRAQLSELFRKYPEPFLLDCVDIGIKQYFRYKDGELTQESVSQFLNKLGGIAYNKSRSPVEQELNHIKSACKRAYPYWNDARADDILARYVCALRKATWSDEQILNDLQTEVKRISKSSRNWSQWSDIMEQWIEDIEKWDTNDDATIQESGTILPSQLFENIPSYNIQAICKQINASYENNLYDCTCVMMRRLLEGLLVLTYQNYGIESEITDKNGWHFTLDKIIKNASQNDILALSANTKRDMALFKDIGNYSAHKIWYNATKQDIEPHMLKYRVIIEELMHKAGIR